MAICRAEYILVIIVIKDMECSDSIFQEVDSKDSIVVYVHHCRREVLDAFTGASKMPVSALANMVRQPTLPYRAVAFPLIL